MANDNKTLELQIRVAADEALKAVSSLKGEISALADRANKFAGTDGAALGKSFKEAEAAAKDAGSGIGEIKKAIGSLAEVAALTKALDVIKDMGAFALHAADNFQTAKNQFGVLLGDMEAGAGLFNEIKAFNDITPFDLDTLTQATNVLVSAKVPLRDLQAQLTKFGDLSQGNSQRLTSYVNAFSQAAAKGKADMQVLNTYLHQGVPILDALAKNFNVTTAEVMEMSSQGKISFADFSKALDDLTAAGGQYFGGMELASKSLAAMQEGLNEAVNSLAASFGEMLMPAAVAVVGALTDLTNWINDSPIVKGVLAGALAMVAGYMAAMAVKAAIAFAAQMKLNFAVGAMNPVVLAATIAVAGIAAGYTILAAEAQKAARKTDDLAYAQRKLREETREGTTAAHQFYRDSLNLELEGALYHMREFQKNIDELLRQGYGRGALNIHGDVDNLRSATEQFTRLRNDFIKNFYDASTDEKIEELTKRISDARTFITTVEISPPDRGKLEKVVSDAQKEIDKLNLDKLLDGAKAWQKTLKDAMNFSDEDFAKGFLDSGAAAITEYARRLQEAEGRALAFKDVMDDEGAVLQNTAGQWEKLLAAMVKSGQWDSTEESVQKVAAALKQARDAAGAAEYAKAMKDLKKEIDDAGKSERQLAYESELARLGLDAQSEAARDLKKAMDTRDARAVLAGLDEEVRNLGKDQHDLALATLAAAGASEEQMRQAREAVAALRAASGELRQGFEELLSRKIAGGLMKAFPKLKEQAADCIGDITARLAAVSFDGLLDGLSAVGRALAGDGEAAENFARAMADMCRRMLQQLPQMFLQAGLQLIISGNWPLGLGFIAAAGSTALLSGYADGSIEQAKKDASKHAHGGVFDEYGRAARAFAAGGAFTNQIVSQPTYFRHGGGLGLMGEAGPEAVMPLTRLPGGDLGVRAAGGGARVSINIINNSGAAVRREESEDAMGNKQYDITIDRIIGDAVNSHIASGKADRAMGGRFGLRAAGV